MKTTLVLDDVIVQRLKERAVRERVSMSSLVETALRMLLDETRPTQKLSRLPSFDTGALLVDVSDRDALYDAMERD